MAKNKGKVDSEVDSSVESRAIQLLGDDRIIYKAGEKIGALGVVGEKRNRTILFLAGVARTLPSPPSVLTKGATSSGKSTLVKSSIRLFPAGCVLERSGLSAKALAHGSSSLAGTIIFLYEYHGGKDAQLLLRLLQSDGRVSHEYTTVEGPRRGTQVAERAGIPVVLTTTTDQKVYPDDETRFLSIWADESPEQNLAILIARAEGTKAIDPGDLPVWQLATSIIAYKKGDFDNPPSWLRYVAENLPLGKVRVRRDWDRFLSFCSAIALCRRGAQAERQVDITFLDYCAAYMIFEPVFASTIRGVRTQELTLARTVANLNRKLQRGATASEIAGAMGWRDSLVYKYVPRAENLGLVKYEPGTREKNTKYIVAVEDETDRFLPRPGVELRDNPTIGKDTEYIDPFTGDPRIVAAARVTPTDQ